MAAWRRAPLLAWRGRGVSAGWRSSTFINVLAMNLTSQPRYMMASFVAPLPATAVAVALGVRVVLAPDEGGSVRAAFVLLALVPFGYVLLALVLLGATRLLAARGASLATCPARSCWRWFSGLGRLDRFH